MPAKKNVRCQRCGKRLKKGGDNYRLECSLITDFDGYIDASISNTNVDKIIGEIETSGLSEAELQEQVYFVLHQKLCLECRNEIVNFLKGYDTNER